MEHQREIAELPVAYAVALRLRERGAPDQEIADALDVPVESVAQLVGIAKAKLAERCGRDPGPTRAAGNGPGP